MKKLPPVVKLFFAGHRHNEYQTIPVHVNRLLTESMKITYPSRLSMHITARGCIRKFLQGRFLFLFIPAFAFASSEYLADIGLHTSQLVSGADCSFIENNLKETNYIASIKAIGIVEDERDETPGFNGDDSSASAANSEGYPASYHLNLFHYRNSLFILNLANSPSAFKINRAYLL